MSSQESKTRANERKKTIEASNQGGKRQHQEGRVNSNFIPFRISKILNTILFHVKYTPLPPPPSLSLLRKRLGSSYTWYNFK